MEIRKMTKPAGRMVLLMLAMSLLVFSCVPNKKIAYLQYGDELNQAASVPVDSMIRIYETGTFSYRLQLDDQVDIKISTTTPDEFNPFVLADKLMTSGSSMGQGQSGQLGYRVDPFGMLNLPVIGPLHVEGMSLFELQDTLALLASSDLENPVVKANLLNFRFSVLGEVSGAGMMRTSDYSLSLLQAMAMAGGVSEFGDLSRVKVIRKINGQSFVFYVNLLDESFLESDFYYVQPNDVIVVSPMKNRILVKSVPQTMGIIASTLSLIVAVLTLISVNSGG